MCFLPMVIIAGGIKPNGVALSVWRFLDGAALPARWRPAYLAMTLGMLTTLLIGADLGGHLVFGHGVGLHTVAPTH